MPTYEYECGSCGVFEIFQSIKDDALKRCPDCGGRDIRRLISGGGGVIFKGDGFWETDYNRSEDYKKAAKQDAEGSSAPASGGDSAAGQDSAAPKKKAGKGKAAPTGDAGKGAATTATAS